ncbi:hypothetical protein ASG52_24645 [Methylobacterium sp. Leaf456]|nr:hypothetical protein ASG52_24645 [Methylobacterium sp. Leaf456]
MGRHESFDPTNAIPFSLGAMGEALPAAGSPEALEAFGAACRAVDAASHLSDADMEALHIAPGASLWTSDKATDALSGNFSRFMPNEIEAARAVPKARLEELLILALRRELRMAEAARTSRIRELHALVYGDEPEPADEDEAPSTGDPDPILALIEANRTAEAAIDAFGREAKARPGIDPDRSAERAMADAQADSWRAVYQTRPTTLAGLAALRDWIVWQIERHREPPEGDGSVWADAYLSLHSALDLVLKPAADPRLVAMVAEWQDVRRKLDDPSAEETPELDALAEQHSTRQREIYLYPARSVLDLLAKVPALRDEMADAARGYDTDGAPKMLAHAAWVGLLADIERIAGAAPAFVAADDAELIALGRAFDTAAAQAQEAEDEHDADPANHQKRIAADKAAEPVYDLAERIAPLPVHTLAGMRVKLRLAAFYWTCLPRKPLEDVHNGEIAICSLYRSTPGIVLGAGPFGVRIVPEA